MKARRRPVAIVGLGCIGGSLARALLAQGVEVRGWSTSPGDRRRAAAAGVAVPEGDAPLDALCHGATSVVLAVPFPSLAVVAQQLRAVAPGVRIFHVGGLQQRAALGVDGETWERLLGTHPLAGSHDTGFEASRADLFVGATVCIEERADARARRGAEWLWRTAGAGHIDYRTAEAHDRLMAWVSHLPQLTSTALGHTLAAAGIDPAEVGSGARDTTRLAATPLGAWPELLRGAPGEVAAAVAQLEATLAELRRVLEARDDTALSALWERAAAWRRQAGSGGAGGERRP